MWCDKAYSQYIDTVSSVPFNYSATFDKKSEEDGRVCKFGVPDKFRLLAEEYENRQPKEKEREEKWQWARDFIANGDLSLENMRLVMKQQLEHVPKLFFIRMNNTFSVMNGRMKGNSQYAKVQRAKIIGYSEKLTRKYRYLYMLTVTCSQKEYGDNRLKAWEEYPRRLQKVNRFIRQRLQGHYVYCLESVVKQFPHAHYVFGTNTEIDFGNFKELNQDKGRNLVVWKQLQSCLPAPVFCLKPVTSKQAIFYCSKYISKAENADLRKMEIPTDKKGRRNARKEWATVVFPIICHIRQWNCAHGIDKVDDLPVSEGYDFHKKAHVSECRVSACEYVSIMGVRMPMKKFDVFEFCKWYENKFEFTTSEMARVYAGFAEIHKMLDNPQTPTAERAELDRLLINLTMSCCCEKRIGSGKAVVELVGDDDVTIENASDSLLEKIRANSARIGCVDCPVMRFILRLQGDTIDAMPEYEKFLQMRQKIQEATDEKKKAWRKANKTKWEMEVNLNTLWDEDRAFYTSFKNKEEFEQFKELAIDKQVAKEYLTWLRFYKES